MKDEILIAKLGGRYLSSLSGSKSFRHVAPGVFMTSGVSFLCSRISGVGDPGKAHHFDAARSAFDQGVHTRRTGGAAGKHVVDKQHRTVPHRSNAVGAQCDCPTKRCAPRLFAKASQTGRSLTPFERIDTQPPLPAPLQLAREQSRLIIAAFQQSQTMQRDRHEHRLLAYHSVIKLVRHHTPHQTRERCFPAMFQAQNKPARHSVVHPGRHNALITGLTGLLERAPAIHAKPAMFGNRDAAGRAPWRIDQVDQRAKPCPYVVHRAHADSVARLALRAQARQGAR